MKEPQDFAPELLAGLGQLVVRWSYAEYLISELFVWAVEGKPEPLGVVTANISTNTLCVWIRTVLDATNNYSDEAHQIRQALVDFDELRKERNTLVHGLWGLSKVPMSAIVQVIRLDRSTIVNELVVTPSDLDALIHEICDLIVTLREILLRLGVKL